MTEGTICPYGCVISQFVQIIIEKTWLVNYSSCGRSWNWLQMEDWRWLMVMTALCLCSITCLTIARILDIYLKRLWKWNTTIFSVIKWLLMSVLLFDCLTVIKTQNILFSVYKIFDKNIFNSTEWDLHSSNFRIPISSIRFI